MFLLTIIKHAFGIFEVWSQFQKSKSAPMSYAHQFMYLVRTTRCVLRPTIMGN